MSAAVEGGALDRYRQKVADHSAVGSEIVKGENYGYPDLACKIALDLAELWCLVMDNPHYNRTETGFVGHRVAALFGTLTLLRVPRNPVAP